MAPAFLASEEELQGIHDLTSLRIFAGLDEDAWANFEGPLGIGVIGGSAGLKVFAAIPASVVGEQCKAAKVGSRGFTAIELSQVSLMWRVVRQKLKLPDQDPFAHETSAQQVQPSKLAEAPEQRKELEQAEKIKELEKRLKQLETENEQARKIAELEKKLKQVETEKKMLAQQLKSAERAAGAKPQAAPSLRQATGFVERPRLSWRRQGPESNDAVVRGLAYAGANYGEDLFGAFHGAKDFSHAIPSTRWDHSLLFDPEQNAKFKVYTNHVCFLDGMELFDHALFGLLKGEARRFDPQVKKCLEAGKEALRRSNIKHKILDEQDTAVYVGNMTFDWFTTREKQHNDNDAEREPRNLRLGEASAMSYVLDLHGPSETVDTACSSSLVAAHSAVNQIQCGRCGFALAAGVCYIGAGETFISRCTAKLLSRVGLSQPFDVSADGYLRGEAYGALLLARSSGSPEGQPLVAGTCVNQDGKSTTLTAPNGTAQTALLRSCHNVAGLMPNEISCIECAAKGSLMGDAIEFTSISRIHGGHTLVLSAAKSNKGHTEGGSGLTGLVKTLVMMQTQQVMPIVHLEHTNPMIESEQMVGPWEDVKFKDYGVFLPHHATDLALFHKKPVSMGVSAFGFGGTNAHAMLRQRQQQPPYYYTKLRPAIRPQESLYYRQWEQLLS